MPNYPGRLLQDGLAILSNCSRTASRFSPTAPGRPCDSLPTAPGRPCDSRSSLATQHGSRRLGRRIRRHLRRTCFTRSPPRQRTGESEELSFPGDKWAPGHHGLFVAATTNTWRRGSRYSPSILLVSVLHCLFQPPK